MTQDELFAMGVDEEAMLADGFDHCIIGACIKTGRAVYNAERIVETLTADMSEEEAWEYFDFNIAGAYVGEMTPIFVVGMREGTIINASP